MDFSSIKFPTMTALDLGFPEDWVYRDVPLMSYEMWDSMLDILGDGNFAIIAATTRPDAKRGQFVISPKGMENLKNFSAKA